MSPARTASPSIEQRLTADDLHASLARDVRQGLTSHPKTLPPKYFYDARGSQLFEQITRLPEYYLTRAERAILVAHADQIAEQAQADTLVELGSGSSEKTRMLLDAMQATGRLRRYAPVDVSRSALAAAIAALHVDYPAVQIQAQVADLDRHLHLLVPGGGTQLVAFLGSTIGNYVPRLRARFLAGLRATLGTEDALLLGIDLVKDPARLLAAYDDPSGVTAAFNRNVLDVINRELDADFDPAAFAHVARWDADNEWIEMRLRANQSCTVHVSELGLSVPFTAGEQMTTEFSAKLRRDRFQTELIAAGLAPAGWWTDPHGDFALVLARVQPR